MEGGRPPHPSCYCEVEAVVKVSWSDDNRGRRFFWCYKYSPEGNNHCKFFLWKDSLMCNRAVEVIPGLLRNRRVMEREMRKLQVDLEVSRAREIILDEEVNDSRGRQSKGWIVGIVYLIYLLAAKRVIHQIVEENDEMAEQNMDLQDELRVVQGRTRKLWTALILSWLFFLVDFYMNGSSDL